MPSNAPSKRSISTNVSVSRGVSTPTSVRRGNSAVAARTKVTSLNLSSQSAPTYISHRNFDVESYTSRITEDNTHVVHSTLTHSAFDASNQISQTYIKRPSVAPTLTMGRRQLSHCISPHTMTRRSFATLDIACPPLGDSVLEGDVLEWKKNVGDWVNEDDTLCVLETAKVVIDIPAPRSGLLKEQRISVGDVANVGDILAVLDPEAAKPAGGADAAPKKAAAEPTKTDSKSASAAPAAPAKAPEAQKVAPTSTSDASVPTTPSAREDRRVKMTRMRQTIAQRLKDSQNTMAILSTFNEIDMTNAMTMRSDFKDAFEKKHGVRLGLMSIFMAASASALQKFPDVNAYIDGNDVVYRNYVDISIAVSTPTGLVVPVVRDVQNKSFAELEKSVADFGARARKGTIAMEEFVGGTFTISNGGVYGSLFGTPIINPPQSAILGMHGIKDRAVVIDGKVVPRKMMYVALSYDHRLIDGATGVQFLKHIKECVEDPRLLLVDF